MIGSENRFVARRERADQRPYFRFFACSSCRNFRRTMAQAMPNPMTNTANTTAIPSASGSPWELVDERREDVAASHP
jgi:hypothetical protein